LSGAANADLAVVGGGFTGLWTALLAKEQEPDRDVVLLDGGRLAWAASGRNGGFCSASLTHGLSNAVERFPDEAQLLVRMGKENLAGIAETLARHSIDCDWESTGYLTAATADWQLPGREEFARLASTYGIDAQVLDQQQVRARVDSPTYLGGLFMPSDGALVNPAKLAWGLASAAERLGVRIHEHSPVRGLARHGAQVQLQCDGGEVSADAAALATNGFRPFSTLGRLSVVPVYNYALMTEPLTEQQLSRIGWQGREGLSDAAAELYYYRLSADNRILWGGPHTDYFFGNGIAARHENRPELFVRLADDFQRTFPQLDDVRFSHAWGGVIDIDSRATNYWEQLHGGQVVATMGFSGLGVGSSRFGAQVMLDLLDGVDNERTNLRFVRERPLPFPPEPMRSLGVTITKRAIRAIDQNDGRRNLWLRALDWLGVGFDG
jgi:glycine/D-amino acid oxidase-like deaminating enzyme